jgi:3-deoxy-7-phosphoheptulonate synthase
MNEPILKSRRRPDVETTVVAVGDVRFGDGSYPVVAGPVAVESEEQILNSALAAAEAGASVLRAGTFRAEQTPYAFPGLGQEGVWMLEHAGKESGLPVATEVLDPGHVSAVVEHVDLIEVGPDNMQNFALVKAAGASQLPVILHRGPSATVDEWLMSAEYVLAEDNDNVILCERGSRGFDPRTTDTLDISAIPVVQRLSHLPVIIHPAPAKGSAELVKPLALAGRSAGADGLMVSIHPDPLGSKVGNGSQLALPEFGRLMEGLGIPSMRDEIDRIDRALVRLVANRLRSSVEIGKIKSARGLAMRSPMREHELIEEAREDARALGVDPDYVQQLFEVILDNSRAAQQSAVEASE